MRRAVIGNDAAQIRHLLEAGASTDSSDAYGKSILMDAAEQGHADSLLLLASQSRLIDAQNDKGDTALLLAAVSPNHLEVCRTLLDAGADTRLRNNRRELAADIASSAGHAGAARLIAQRKASGLWRPDWL